MPTVNVDRDNLFKSLGRSFSNADASSATAEFEELCFEFGIELEEETSEQEMVAKEVGADKAKDLSSRPIYRIDIPANRYDLLCPEGINRALRVFLGLQKPPTYNVISPANGRKAERLYVKAETASVRPFVVAAILRNVNFDQDSYNSFIDLQDKLHNNICRKRTLVAIGTHDLDTISGPFSYEALPPKDIKFTPLNQSVSMTGEELMTFYEADRKLSKFLHIIKDSPRYPIIYDSKRTVLSLPPIINGDHSKIKLSTKNVFIECTATDLTKAKVVLNTVVAMFSQYAKDQFSVEPVEVIYSDGREEIYPDLSVREVKTTSKYINGRIGINLDTEKIVELLSKMSLSAVAGTEEGSIIVSVPPTRSDILHACDVAEDVAIAYGYNNIEETTPQAYTVAAPLPLNKLSDLVRREIALSGYTEVLPLILCSHDENFSYLRKVDDNKTAIKLANPKTVEYQVVRTSLLPGLLKTIASNKDHSMPMKIFEVSDVAFKDDTLERRARNERHVGIVYSNLKGSGFELIHGMLDRIMAMLNVPLVRINEDGGYYVKESENATFFPGRRADVFYNRKLIGAFGILHPEVVQKFDFLYPTSALEFNLEPFL
ncbi:phenylalanine--tRNA ligase subunit beta [Dinochytrium kinnereticum]|nr:phenylalanine--tRNA ligase subunit beta [Dinochytrium kinnereticum]